MIVLTSLRMPMLISVDPFPFSWWMDNNEQNQVVDLIPFIQIFKIYQIMLDNNRWAFL